MNRRYRLVAVTNLYLEEEEKLVMIFTWKSRGLPGSSQPQMRRDTPKGRTPPDWGGKGMTKNTKI